MRCYRGQSIQVPLDIELLPSPELNDASNSDLLQYLRDVSRNSTFTQSILQGLIEERHEDQVKAHVVVHSNTDTHTVQKLSYQAKGPFIIVEDIKLECYAVRRYNQP